MKNIKAVFWSFVAAVLVLPVAASAQIIDLGGGNAKGVLEQIMDILNRYVITGLIAVAIIYFLINVLKYIMNADNPDERKKAQEGIIYGLIGLVVMLSFWGLVYFIQRSFNLGSGGTVRPEGIPTFPRTNPSVNY